MVPRISPIIAAHAKDWNIESSNFLKEPPDPFFDRIHLPGGETVRNGHIWYNR
jgi:hypothetical protein